MESYKGPGKINSFMLLNVGSYVSYALFPKVGGSL